MIIVEIVSDKLSEFREQAKDLTTWAFEHKAQSVRLDETPYKKIVEVTFDDEHSAWSFRSLVDLHYPYFSHKAYLL